jgi:F-type H+-transporting ATPase subunit delta
MARPSTAARRYAEAAYEVAARDDALDEWRDGLALAAELAADEKVAAIIDNPAVPLADRETVIGRLLDGRAPTGVRNIVRLLARRGRVDLLSTVAAEYVRRLNRERGVVEAVVTSAVPLDPDETAAVRERVEALAGATVDLRSEVDADLIGGIVVRIGDRLFDSSVRGRLERLRSQLVAGTR